MIKHSLKALLHSFGLMASLLLVFNLTGLGLGSLLGFISHYLGAAWAVIIGLFVCLIAAFGTLATQAGYYQWYFGEEAYQKQDVGCLLGVFMLASLVGGSGYFFYTASTMHELLKKDHGKVYEAQHWNDFPANPQAYLYWKIPADYQVDTTKLYFAESQYKSSSKGHSIVSYTDHICFPITNRPGLYWALSLKNGDSKNGRSFKSIRIAHQRVSQKASYFQRLNPSNFDAARRPSTGERVVENALFLQALPQAPEDDRHLAWSEFWFWIAQCNLGALVFAALLALSFFYQALTQAKS
jgi:hypothetical protein